ncbi:class I SAM-dependent methyltransferase [Dyadobacter sp. 32]|uniref:class I SAM-dependent methyltransferase n=1 Tax=Dyadobacter sp. 32 TaxID=538966 RepID=UPI0011EC40B6
MSESLYTDGAYLKNHPDWHAEDSKWKAEKITTLLNKNKVKPTTICEIGCGAGEILNRLYSSLPDKCNFVGYDISADAIEMATSRAKDRINFVQGDLLATLPPRSFDLLLMIDVFEHVDDYLGFLKKCKNLAEYKVFHIPLDMTVQKILRKQVLMDARHNVGHLHYFTRETALATLRDAGYEIIDSNFTPWGFEMPQKSLLKRIFRLPFWLFYQFNADLAVRIMGGSSLIVLAK